MKASIENMISDNGAKMLGEALMINSTLVMLTLEGDEKRSNNNLTFR